MGEGKPKQWTLEAVNPFGDSTAPFEVWLPQAHVDGLTRHGVEARFCRLRLVPEVLKDPVVVFQGWEREGQDEGLCYVGNPDRDYRSTTIEAPSPPGMVFLVFVTLQGKISEWRWEPCDEDNPSYPENFKERFRRIVWPTRQTL